MELADEERALVDILIQASAAGKDLGKTIRDIAVAKGQAAQATDDLGIGEKHQTEQMAEFNEQLDTMNLRMNAITMGAGLASSAITIFGGAVGLDKRESAAAAMTAMHLSTIPNIIGMVTMQAHMLKAAGAATTFAGAVRKIAGPMAVAFAAITVISGVLGKYSANKERATQREKEHAAAIKATNEALLSETASLDYALITDETLTNQQLIADIREDDAQLAILNEKDKLNSLEMLQKQELEESLEHNKALLLARAGLALEDDKITDDLISNYAKYEGDISAINQRIVDDTFSMNADLQHLADLSDQQDSPIDTHAITRRVEFFADSIANLGMTIEDLEAMGGDIELFAALFEIGFLNAESTVDDFVAIINALPDEIRDNTDEVTSQFDEMESSITGFSSALEEFYYGGQISMATGDLLKQVVQKGAENLIQNTELIMTNNFFGLTLPEMVDTISNAVTDQLVQQGIVQSSGMTT
jgi:preprotein translocase subunit SecG